MIEETSGSTDEVLADSSEACSSTATPLSSSRMQVLEALNIFHFIPELIQNRETASSVDAVKFKVCGQDFTVELVLMLDIFTPLKDLLERCQRVEQYIWNSVSWILTS